MSPGCWGWFFTSGVVWTSSVDGVPATSPSPFIDVLGGCPLLMAWCCTAQQHRHHHIYFPCTLHYKKDKELLEKVQRRFTKMGIKGKSYQQRLQNLNLWSLVERRNRQDLTEMFKICKGWSRIRPEELFHFGDRGKGTRGRSLKLVKVRCTRDSRRHFFLIGYIGWQWRNFFISYICQLFSAML